MSTAEQQKKIVQCFGRKYIYVRTVDPVIAVKARDIIQAHGLAPMDAIHVATAIEMKVEVLYTYDSKKQRRKGLLVHDGKIDNLRIEVPKVTPLPLFPPGSQAVP